MSSEGVRRWRGLRIQGRQGEKIWVKRVKIGYSMDGKEWRMVDKVF